MLMAFITMNTSNSGFLSAKANSISRTFPPLFMIKISEEEKIAEDLHEIESMQLIVQVIMIIVCILIAFIVLYYCCKKLECECLHCSNIVFHFSLYQEYCKHHEELIYL